MVCLPAHEAGALAAVDEAHGALVSNLQALRQMGDPGPGGGSRAHEKQELVLGRRNPGAPGRVSREPEETAQRVPKSGERKVIRLLQRPAAAREGSHTGNIS
jgi:hypothetical protein